VQRGFAIIARASDGAIIRRTFEINVGEQLEARLADGTITARVTARNKA